MSVIYQNGCIMVVLLSGVHQPNWMSTEEAVLLACTLYSQLVLTYSQKHCFISLPRAGFANIFCVSLLPFHLLTWPRTILICHCTTNSVGSQIWLWAIMSKASLYSTEGNEILYTGSGAKRRNHCCTALDEANNIFFFSFNI